MKVSHSLGNIVGKGAIGTVAYNSVEGLFAADILSQSISTGYSKQITNLKQKKQIITFTSIKFLDYGLGFTQARFIQKMPHYEIINELYDIRASNVLKSSNIFHGWGGMCERQLKKAKKLGAKTIVEWASQHPIAQRKILEEEYVKFNVPFPLGNEKLFQKSLRELSFTDYVKIPSKFVEKSFIDQGFDKNKLLLLPFGVDFNKFSPGKKSKEFSIVFVGAIGLLKGVHYLLQAWDELKLKNAKLHLVGAILHDIKHILPKYMNRKDIIFHGHTNPAPILKQAHVFVFPSLTEGSALVTYEAMASGLASIVTENSGSIVRHGKDGFVIKIRDVNAIKNNILKFYKNPLLSKKMGSCARKRAITYTWKNYQEEYVKKLKRIV